MDSKAPKIVVVDSGIEHNHPCFEKVHINGIGIEYNEQIGSFECVPDYNDRNGHGTAICSIITKLLKCNDIPFELFIVKIFDDTVYASEERLFFALNYIEQYIECNILHLSLGVTYCSRLNELHDICKKLKSKGVVLVSAFDNLGAMSYPAAFEEVIGVDSVAQCKNPHEWFYANNSAINIFAKSGVHRSAWLNGGKMLVEGNSFSAAYITAFIAEYYYKDGNMDFDKALGLLKRKASLIDDNPTPVKKIRTFAMPKSAVVFPFNKEIHSLRRYESHLPFKIMGYFDCSYSRHINKSCDSLIGGLVTGNEKDIIGDIDSLDWHDDFDTFILGHVGVISNLTTRDYLNEIVEKCIAHGKNLFSFDPINLNNYPINERKINVYSPGICDKAFLSNHYGKLYRIGKPIIGVFGTSARQGKFTIQLFLRYKFVNEGYNVGQLGTEPHSELFGMDYSVPIGYNSSIMIDGDNFLVAVNNIMHQIELKDPDIIIVGAQSSTIPYDLSNTKFFSNYQHYFLYATAPDCIVLVINVFDDLSYIRRTISYLNSISKVIAIAIYPVNYKSSIGGRVFIDNNYSIDDLKKTIAKEFGIPAFSQDSKEDLICLYKVCEDYFSAD